MRRVITRVSMILSILLLNAGFGLAQTCVGGLPFSARSAQIGSTSSFGDGFQTYDVTGAFGSQSIFVRGGAAFANFNDLDATGSGFGATVGSEFQAANGRLFLCPEANLSFMFGPELFEGADLSSISFSSGPRVGIVLNNDDELRVIPTVGFLVMHQRQKFEFLGVDETETDTFGVLHVGVGLAMRDRMSIVPGVTFPLGLDGADPSFSLSVVFGFGR
jgi:hypothetical protein